MAPPVLPANGSVSATGKQRHPGGERRGVPDGAARAGAAPRRPLHPPLYPPIEVPALRLRPPLLRRFFLPSPHLSLSPAAATAAAAATFPSPPQRSPAPRPPARGRHLCGGLARTARGQSTPARSAPAQKPPVLGGGWWQEGRGQIDGRGWHPPGGGACGGRGRVRGWRCGSWALGLGLGLGRGPDLGPGAGAGVWPRLGLCRVEWRVEWAAPSLYTEAAISTTEVKALPAHLPRGQGEPETVSTRGISPAAQAQCPTSEGKGEEIPFSRSLCREELSSFNTCNVQLMSWMLICDYPLLNVCPVNRYGSKWFYCSVWLNDLLQQWTE